MKEWGLFRNHGRESAKLELLSTLPTVTGDEFSISLLDSYHYYMSVPVVSLHQDRILSYTHDLVSSP